MPLVKAAASSLPTAYSAVPYGLRLSGHQSSTGTSTISRPTSGIGPMSCSGMRVNQLGTAPAGDRQDVQGEPEQHRLAWRA